jgi:hypothetical protein
MAQNRRNVFHFRPVIPFREPNLTMRLLPVIHFIRKSISLLLVTTLACDPFEGELPNQFEFKQTEFYILSGSSTVIDLKALIKKSFVTASLTIAENPTKGTLAPMDASVYKYTPNNDFIEGDDQFIVSAVLDDGTTINSKPMIVYMKSSETEFPCVYPVEDYIRIDPISTVVIHVLMNDRICDVDEPVDVIVHVAPKFGEAVVVGDSIVYTPGPSFSRRDEFVYSVSTSNGEKVSFGLVSFNSSKFEFLEIPEPLGPNYETYYDKIFFIDDMTGFITGGRAIQKTIDGGRHWIQLTYPTSGDEVVNFEDIYFLDKDHGFAAFSACPRNEFCAGGWMMTKNGGVSWDRFDLKESVSSIIFTSPLIGYIGTYTRWDEFGEPLYRSVFKTVDGGETWDQVEGLNTSNVGRVDLRFATDDVGWVYQEQNYSINSTTDGGKTWEVFFTNSNVTSLAVASDNVICASVAQNGPWSTAPSAIVRSENGSPFQTINFPYLIGPQGFSPEGELGIAVGASWSDIFLAEILTVNISTDKGKTWVDLAEQLAEEPFGGYPLAISVPSSRVAYIIIGGEVYSSGIIKYIP